LFVFKLTLCTIHARTNSSSVMRPLEESMGPIHFRNHDINVSNFLISLECC